MASKVSYFTLKHAGRTLLLREHGLIPHSAAGSRRAPPRRCTTAQAGAIPALAGTLLDARHDAAGRTAQYFRTCSRDSSDSLPPPQQWARYPHSARYRPSRGLRWRQAASCQVPHSGSRVVPSGRGLRPSAQVCMITVRGRGDTRAPSRWTSITCECVCWTCARVRVMQGCGDTYLAAGEASNECDARLHLRRSCKAPARKDKR